MNSKLSQKIKIESLDDLEKFASDFSNQINLPTLLCLTGDLGSGKTTFTKLLAKSFGLNPDLVTSPTYNLQSIYNNTNVVLEHWDLYRVDSLPIELEQEPQGNQIFVVEWAEKFSELVEVADYVIRFEIVSESERVLSLMSR